MAPTESAGDLVLSTSLTVRTAVSVRDDGNMGD